MRKNIRLIVLLVLCSMLALGCGRITDEDCFYVYFKMPLDDEYNAYRVKNIVMNKGV